jgi:CBS domain-containing protein
MLERRIGCLPVVEDGRLVGILSESDFLRRVAEG